MRYDQLATTEPQHNISFKRWMQLALSFLRATAAIAAAQGHSVLWNHDLIKESHFT